MERKVTVVGGAGFVGTNLCRLLDYQKIQELVINSLNIIKEVK